VQQIIPPISITGGQPSLLLPLMFVIFVSMVKDIIEDIKRHKSDNEENNRKALVGNTKTGMFEFRMWKDIKVGNIVKVKNKFKTKVIENQFFPADLILINSSIIKNICYIETKNLDGETNLKHKQGKNVPSLLFCGNEERSDALTIKLRGNIEC
jgi:P-type E1-E2 ATPase